MNIRITVAGSEHVSHAEEICNLMEEAAKKRGTGIAKRKPEYIKSKMEEGKAVIAIDTEGNHLAGFSYIESWDDKKYIANSGLIVHPHYRKMGLGRRIKKRIFKLSRTKYPDAKIFGITTSMAVMKINSDMGYKPVTYSELTKDEKFWKGCQSCPNYDILTNENRKDCLCTGMLYDPNQETEDHSTDKRTRWKKFKRFVRLHQRQLQRKTRKLLNLTKMTDNKNKERIVLAFSGGLDTSYCVPYLKEQHQAEIHTVLVNTGGFDKQELADIEKHAYTLGSDNHQTLHKTNDYYDNIIRFMIFGNVLKNNTYPLSVSSERVFQAVAIAKYALESGADAIAHGSTGAGNDQVRFDLVFNVIAPDLDIITPIRDQQLTREEEVAYLKTHKVDMDWSEAKYSINKGLWGTSVGGAETLTSDQPLPEDAYPSPLEKKEPQTINLGFKEGEPVSIDEKEYDPVELIRTLDAIGSAYAIGRDIHVGDTIIGIKGRVGFEAAAAMLIIKAHEQLEKHVLTKWQLYWKDQLADWYGMMLHEGQYLDPVMRNIESFLSDTQSTVNGSVTIRLSPYRFAIEGISSPNDLMNAKFGDYGEMNNAWSGEDVRGFAKILSNQINIHQSVNNYD